MQLSRISLHGIDPPSFHSTSCEGWPLARWILYIGSLGRRLCMLLRPNMNSTCASRSTWPSIHRGCADSFVQLLSSVAVYVDSKILIEFILCEGMSWKRQRIILYLRPIEDIKHIDPFLFRLWFWILGGVPTLHSCGTSDWSKYIKNSRLRMWHSISLLRMLLSMLLPTRCREDFQQQCENHVERAKSSKWSK